MKEQTTYPVNFSQRDRRADLNLPAPQSPADSGIEVHEEEWGTVTVQPLYKMRCECGRHGSSLNSRSSSGALPAMRSAWFPSNEARAMPREIPAHPH